MAHPPLRTLTPFKVSNPQNSVPPNPLPTTREGKAIPTPHTKTPTHLLKISCDHEGSSVEPPILHNLHLMESMMEKFIAAQLRIMNLLVRQSIY